jgi:IS30 family transposase
MSLSEIAWNLGRSKSTISRELKRNADSQGHYDATKAQEKAKTRLSHSRRKYAGLLAEFLVQELERDLSPDQIVMSYPHLPLSTQGIYDFIWRDYENRGELWRNLRYCGKGKHLRTYNRGPGKSRITRNKAHSIDLRPPSVDDRLHYGHWEMDLIEAKGRRRPILVLIERKSRYVLAGFLGGKWSQDVARVASRLLRGLKVKSITTDNGPEFLNTALLESKLNTTIYYTHAYKSWQKGAVENINKFLRQYFIKGTSFDHFAHQQPSIVCRKINERPRRSLDCKSPQQLRKLLLLSN